MRESLDLPALPGYLSIKQAARHLGYSETRIYKLVEEGRLSAFHGGKTILLPKEEVENYKPKPTGRPQKNTPSWRSTSLGDRQMTTLIVAQLRTGSFEAIEEKLQAINGCNHISFQARLTVP